MLSKRILPSFFLLSAIFSLAKHSDAAVDIWVEFDSAWETEIATAAFDAGISPLTAGEVDVIEAGVIGELERIYDGYEMTFIPAAAPPASYDMRIDYGATSSDAGDLGKAPIIFGLAQTHIERDATAPGDAPHKANIFSANFKFYPEPSDPRATQLAELVAPLGRFGAHELGHSMGLLHHHVYGNAGIGPDNYGDTGGLQNTAVMATGTSIAGDFEIFEAITEMPATLGKWERALLDTTGGSIINFDPPVGVGMGKSVVMDPIITECEMGICAPPPDLMDVGDTLATSQLLTKSIGESSGLDMWYVSGFNHDLPGAAPDVDMYSIEVESDGLLTVDLWSEFAFIPFFNTEVTVIDSSGVDIFANDDATYDDNGFDLGLEGATGPFGSVNSFISNLPILEAGTYYVKVSQSGVDPSFHPYALIMGFQPVPEPGTSLLVLIAIGAAAVRRRSLCRDSERVQS